MWSTRRRATPSRPCRSDDASSRRSRGSRRHARTHHACCAPPTCPCAHEDRIAQQAPQRAPTTIRFQDQRVTTNTLAITPWRCQFCHGATSETSRVVAGDSGFICETCVKRCITALGEHPGKAETDDDVGLRSRLEQHFAPQRPEALLTTSRSFPIRQQADLQKALDDLLGERRIPENFVGVFMRYGGYESLTFARVLTDSRGD
ncbi:ClpX C4-type zinc finger protein [Dokdonella sp. MW10]|uniref:ClpX C4-type zinc finger protein n=1 Tax=Dokdonella sp. MW10 TaxID=2992926 RepID=UPI003F7D3DF4